MKRWLLPLLLVLPIPLIANEAQVVKATADCNERRICRFSVTVSHQDTGWSHYADGWVVTTESGEVLGKRTLLHPHVEEQPFTRSLSGVSIPAGISQVRIRVHDSVHGESSQRYTIKLDLP